MRSAARLVLLVAICGQALLAQGLLVNPGFEQHRSNPVGWRLPSSVITNPRLVAKDRLGARADQAFEFSATASKGYGVFRERVLEQTVTIKVAGYYSFGAAWRLVGAAHKDKMVSCTVSVGVARTLVNRGSRQMADHRVVSYLKAGTYPFGFDVLAIGSQNTALSYQIRVDDFSLEFAGTSSGRTPQLGLWPEKNGSYSLGVFVGSNPPLSLVFMSLGKLARGVRIPGINEELWLDPFAPPGILLLGSNAQKLGFNVPLPPAISGVRIYAQTLSVTGVSKPIFGNWNAIYLRGQ